MLRIVLAFVVLGLCGVSALAQPADNNDARLYAKATQDILAFYPPRPLADQIEGSAKLSCLRTRHGRPHDCTLVSEDPAGEGFGQAALAIAAAAVDRPDVNLSAQVAAAPWNVTIRFSPSPARIAPNLLLPFELSDEASFIRSPSGAEIAAVYPYRAMMFRKEGVVVLLCRVTEAGLMSDCETVSDSDPNWGFASAASELASDFQINPNAAGGYSMAGQRMTLHFSFRLPPYGPS